MPFFKGIGNKAKPLTATCFYYGGYNQFVQKPFFSTGSDKYVNLMLKHDKNGGEERLLDKVGVTNGQEGQVC